MDDAAIFTVIERRLAGQSLPPLAFYAMYAGAPALGAETISTHDDIPLSVEDIHGHPSFDNDRSRSSETACSATRGVSLPEEALSRPIALPRQAPVTLTRGAIVRVKSSSSS